MADSTPAKTPAKTPASTARQRSIQSYFGKPSSSPASHQSPLPRSSDGGSARKPSIGTTLKETTKANCLSNAIRPIATPVASSDPAGLDSPLDSLPSGALKVVVGHGNIVPSSSPVRQARRKVNYVESSDDDEEDGLVFLNRSENRHRRNQRINTAASDNDNDDDDYDQVASVEGEVDDDDMADFIASESEGDNRSTSRKRKRGAKKSQLPRKKANMPLPSPVAKKEDGDDEIMGEDGNLGHLGLTAEDNDDEMPRSTAQKWAFVADDPEAHAVQAEKARTRNTSTPGREKVCHKPPEERYHWLANIKDADGNPAGHAEYDPSTVYVPPQAWNKFSPFEKQYWDIKRKLWDTIVFFKKGKFFELYENDATVGHQLFNLKLTDRVNMRMVGVPESSLEMWVNQFVAKGFKVARVDQMESALGKEMRERDDTGPPKKADKIIRRELSCVLTGGTLVDGRMLQDDLATYCAAIKQCDFSDPPSFGIAFVDTATGRFSVSEFQDDADMTKLETFVAQTSPRELVLEKSRLSAKALRLLKNNTGPTTIWNHRRPGSEFWDADRTIREIDAERYFAPDGSADGDQKESWPAVLREATAGGRGGEYGDNGDRGLLLLSALGGLIDYLRFLKLERHLLSQADFEWYSPIEKKATLVLDGQTLVNLEVFANSVDGGAEGTLFGLLNRCVTPFGKRLLRRWVAHPLGDGERIAERLDAVELLNSNSGLREQFASRLTKMPDLERLMSRIHAGACRADDFARVVEGFEQMDQTMSVLGPLRGRSRLVDRLAGSMPDLSRPLGHWLSAFDRTAARDRRVLVPERGVERDYDESQDTIADIKRQLDSLIATQRAELKCKTLKFADIGKEIYQMEAPKSLRVPASWRQMSAAGSVKRYYFGRLTDLVRELQEAEETHSQISREVASRFCRRFDADRDTWLRAVDVVAQIDCLVGLARTSTSLGEPACRPQFVDQDRTVVEFEELRHPCMLNAVSDFIPNDVELGGDSEKINLLTGANAAGKSTVLRMTCIAVIMGQIGCYVPAKSARLTPVDRIMSRLGANDNIFAAQSTFFVELSETKKILSEATPRSLVILDELGRGTSSYDGVAVAQAVLHHLASHIGCVGFFATHYHSLAAEFENHPEIQARRMQIRVDDGARRIVFMYRLEDGVAEGSFGMHCAAMCGIADRIIDRAEYAAREFEHTSRMKDSLDRAKTGCYIPLGMLSDMSAVLDGRMARPALDVFLRTLDQLRNG